jgi:DNA-binding MarR family transcriptional regulator
MNIIDESGILAISTRLQRLSEQIRKDGAQIYKAYDIDFEPKWFPVVFTLAKKQSLGIMDLATEIGYTHPSTISLLKEMEKEKLIRSKKDKNDERKRLVQLTPKAEELILKMKPVWELMIAAMAEATETQDNLLKAITQVEEKLKEQSFLQRALRIKNKG